MQRLSMVVIRKMRWISVMRYFQLEAPFNGEAKSFLKTINRYSGIDWGNDDIAVASDYWWKTRNTKTYVFNPSDPSQNQR